MFPIDSHNTSYLYLREDGTYYWQHCRKEAEDDVFIDADGIQLDLFGKPVLNKEFIMKETLQFLKNNGILDKQIDTLYNLNE